MVFCKLVIKLSQHFYEQHSFSADEGEGFFSGVVKSRHALGGEALCLFDDPKMRKWLIKNNFQVIRINIGKRQHVVGEFCLSGEVLERYLRSFQTDLDKEDLQNGIVAQSY